MQISIAVATYIKTQTKTQKTDAALRAASVFWVLCPNILSDSYK